MTGSGQESFLHTIAQKLGRSRRSGVTPPDWMQQSSLRVRSDLNRDELVEQFVTNLEALQTKVVRVLPADFPHALADVIDSFTVKSAIYWYDPDLQHLHLEQQLDRHQVKQAVCPVGGESDSFRSVAAAADLGITTAELGVAETGTVVLFNGGRRGRTVSLLPPNYLVILREERIVPTLADVMAHIREEAASGLPACINLITGPSRTGDIEGDLAFGVHGPGRVRIILLKEDGQDA
ncbi:lactate utilization protein C [Brevibacillus humidisoli]|uniref:LutC/YkgG family protein n=1 Tax=Brevibacillus humidisoli TaxID=2895522 RepID=UPI001E65C6A3|nr:lactate utilization protein C [Brevibacillus humidisoli]UFJ38932.1 lactate utilization protein C [Brevibacillus humidisoli]